MKRFTFALAAFALLGLSALAQTKLDLASQAQLRQIRLMQQQTAAPTSRPALKAVSPAAAGKAQTRVLAFARLAEGFTEADLRQEGVDVLRSKLGFVLLNLPLDDVERVAALPSLRSVQLGRKVKPLMKYAREATGVDLVHQGTGLSQAYTGKNVVVMVIMVTMIVIMMVVVLKAFEGLSQSTPSHYLSFSSLSLFLAENLSFRTEVFRHFDE